jgi:1,4-dihydroxy-2-naphthoyl-CoA hydrolase
MAAGRQRTQVTGAVAAKPPAADRAAGRRTPGTKTPAGEPAAGAAAARAAPVAGRLPGTSKAAPFRHNGPRGVALIMEGQPARRLGVQLVCATRTKIVARLPVRPHHTNRGQRVNGGVLMAFADLLGAAGTVMNLEPGWRTTTLESKTNFFAAGQPPMLLAESTPLHVGRSTNVWQTRITNEDGRLVALVTQTQIVLPPPVVP